MSDMTSGRRWAKLTIAMVMAVPLGVLGTASPSAAETTFSAVPDDDSKKPGDVDGCDRTGTPGIYDDSGSRTYKGRHLTLYTEKIWDYWAHATITGKVARKDKVYVQRSLYAFNMHSKPRYPSDDYVRAMGGVKTCRHIANNSDASSDYARTGSVALQTGEDNRSHAVRACVKPTGGKFKCTRWFIDHY
ncbi:hypothetical protein [Amycolatopsis keratiniphila]|uniref:Secreted protein n=1 Tax=Amycolatopsis keratiniphila subsp. keratiniphila TaxID=227715 RepID=A0A1W2M1K7_9PSEU|nr:hypothetical protein [Amycolatopsis keratiniphila]ONF73744.1 hypothetical protein AVR91_0206490 [Amycolatopsis keratiniphila subsp. keratiniphila]